MKMFFALHLALAALSSVVIAAQYVAADIDPAILRNRKSFALLIGPGCRRRGTPEKKGI